MLNEWWNAGRLRMKALLARKRLERDLQDELAFHLAMREEKNRERGAEESEARYAARRQFGNLLRIKEKCREVWAIATLEALRRDLRYGSRTLAKNPGFAIVAVATIALGIGVNTAIYSILNGVALRLLPIPRADEVVSIDQTFRGHVSRNIHGEAGLFSYPEYLEYRNANHTLSGLAAYEVFLQATMGGDKPEQVNGTVASCNYFDVMKQKPQAGRMFADADCKSPGQSPVVVISDHLWKSRFGTDPEIVGKAISLNRTEFTVIGVAAPDFGGADPWPDDFWAPVTMQKALEPDRDFLNQANTSWLAMLGRMKPGVPIEAVRAEMEVIGAHIDAQEKDRKSVISVHRATFMSRPAERELVVGIGAIVLAAVGLVLLIACANVANLMLAHASTRQREIAIRLSIGGSRWQVVRQLLTESLLISLIGGALGFAAASWSVSGLTRLVIAQLPQEAQRFSINVDADLRVLGYSALLVILTALTFGLGPALQATKKDPGTMMKGENGGMTSGRPEGGKLRRTLVGVQIGVCMVLLIGAGLLLRGLYVAQTIDPGFEMKGITQATFDLPSQGYSEARAQIFQRDLMTRITALPGVDDVEQARVTPLSHQFLGTGMTIEGETQARQFELNAVSPGFFRMLGMPILRGRSFSEEEARSDARVMVVTESTAQRLWAGKDAIGQRMRGWGKQEFQVIGVVKDTQASHLGESGGLFFYMPAGPKEQSELQLLVHGEGDQSQTIKAVQEAAKALDPGLVVDVTRLEDNLETWRTPSRIAAALSGSLGALALLLAASGVYGVASYGASRRVHEIGVRMALGASGRDVMRLLLKQTFWPVTIGAAAGIAACAAVSQVLAKVLYGLGSHDPIAFAGVPLFLLAVALGACYIPTRRATRVDPAVALRYE